MVGVVAAFWSYTHVDNAADGSRILRLAERIKDEFALLTGEDLELFVDHESLKWGDEWGARISQAVEGSTFLIPVITPRFFASDECRREVLTFAGHAASLGVRELLLPILYADVQELHEETPKDEVVAAIGRTQWEDWRELRLLDEGSADYRKAVNKLAVRLAEIRAQVVDSREGAEEQAVADESLEDDEPGVLDVLAAGVEAMPRVVQALTAVGEVLDQLAEAATESNARMQENDDRGKGFAGRLTIAAQFAKTLEPLAEQLEHQSDSYISELVTLDPAVLTIIRQVETNPDELAGSEQLAQFLGTLRGTSIYGRRTATALLEFVGQLDELAKTTRVIRPPVRRIQRSLRAMSDGQAILDEWERLLINLGIEPVLTLPDDPPPGEDQQR